MIYQVCDLDKKILQKTYPFLQYFLVEMTGLAPVYQRKTIKLSTCVDLFVASRSSQTVKGYYAKIVGVCYKHTIICR